jgi:hypothetical protein
MASSRLAASDTKLNRRIPTSRYGASASATASGGPHGTYRSNRSKGSAYAASTTRLTRSLRAVRCALARVDPAQLELARIVAADADAEREPSGGEQRDRGELAGDDRRVTQRDQVHAGLHGHMRMRGQQRGRLDRAVGAVTVGEADVVADGQVVDAGVDSMRGELPEPTGPGTEVLLAEHDADPDGVGGDPGHHRAYRET